MIKLEDLKPGMRIRGLVHNQIVTLIAVEEGSGFKGSDSYKVTAHYTWEGGSNYGHTILSRRDERKLHEEKDKWPFDADGKLFRLVSEAYRIHLAHLFEPLHAIHTSDIVPLPHQITAVYDEMLPRQPLRFLLADDPGAGKTIMAGLLIRELIAREDVHRCLICVPGNLTEQWRDELWSKFRLDFKIFTRDMIRRSRNGNPFAEDNRLIVRLDQAKRNDIQELLSQTTWDLIVCDEAHKMSASFSGGEINRTQRYRLGELLGTLTRHFLLMTATPHNGKQEDFHLFLKLLDADRFEGRFRDGVHQVDVSDLMRRVVKEDLMTFEGKPLFPERKAYTVDYELSDQEEALYDDVTEYIRNEFNRAEQLEGGYKNTVGFALTILQRRLASSPEAIYQSLKSRRQRLENRLREGLDRFLRHLSYDEEDFEDLPASEREEQEAEFIDRATAALSIDELAEEIDTLRGLEKQASDVLHSGKDRKWNELRKLFDAPEVKNPDGTQRKLIIFTEHLATLDYLIENLQTLFSPGAIVKIHGSIRPEVRREVENRFRDDPNVLILVATDAAGEGINLQQAHLMVNYDLPWNPNRLEQRFGRIHRIGQREVCHLWNLVAGQTREGAVYERLLEKLKTASDALNGQIFDVLGTFFQETSLRELLKEAVRYGDRPEVRARLEQAIDNALDQARVLDILEHQALAIDSIDTSKVMRDKQAAGAGRLQPYYVKAFLLQAFEHFHGGEIAERESGRYEIMKVPQVICDHAKKEGMGGVRREYRRICFDQSSIRLPDRPDKAVFVHPGHPLLDATVSYLLKCERAITLEHGAMLVDESDNDTKLRVLFYLDQSIQNAVPSTISRKIHFVEIDSDGQVREAGVAPPYLDYRPATSRDKEQIKSFLEQDWIKGEELERRTIEYVIEYLVPRYLEEESRSQRIKLISKREGVLRKQLEQYEQQIQELREWKERIWQELCELLDWQEQGEMLDWRELFQQLDWQELIRQPDWQEIARTVEQLIFIQKELPELIKKKDRIEQQSLPQLEQKRQISVAKPFAAGAALIIPIGLLEGRQDNSHLKDRRVTENIAMQAVMQTERELGNQPEDVSKRNLGYDIRSRDESGELRFIEVKGRRAGAETVTLTRNELMTALNCDEKHTLALVEVDGTRACSPCYLRGYPFREPGPSEHSVNFKLRDLLEKSEAPS